MIFLFLLLLLATAQAEEIITTGTLASTHLNETSGIAVSRREAGLFWGINDGNNPPVLHAVGLDGADHGRVVVRRSSNADWEDLASFELDGTPYLLVADTGDNNGRRRVSSLYIIEEPRRSAAGKFAGEIETVTRLPFRFEDGPRDCEAVAVDVASDRVLLVSKHDVPARVYEMPLSLVKNIRRPMLARRIASIVNLPRPTVADFLEAPLLGPWRHAPTALDISPDRAWIGLLTFDSVYFFRLQAGQSWQSSLSVAPVRQRLPRLAQSESLAFGPGNRVLVVAEGRNAAIWSIAGW
ncbi:MAG: hypothetical protein KJO35_00470 [Gammaproteobacteria bacterium]|nr:hypothetical protein [Gammaproteobacteria bacterium]